MEKSEVCMCVSVLICSLGHKSHFALAPLKENCLPYQHQGKKLMDLKLLCLLLEKILDITGQYNTWYALQDIIEMINLT